MAKMSKGKVKGKVKASSNADDIYNIWATTWAIDRDGERIDPNAIKNLQKYIKENPVIYYDHGWMLGTDADSRLPIGKAVRGIRVKDKGIKISFKFHELEFAQKIKYLVDEGVLNSGSIGFIAKDFARDPDGTRVITDAELFELSVVGIPANAEAQIIRGLGNKQEVVLALKSVMDEFKKSEETNGVSEKVDPRPLTRGQKLKMFIADKM
jgi:HK97 family phage prohead protease